MFLRNSLKRVSRTVSSDIDAKAAASNLMYVFEGLKIAARTRGVSESTVDEEIMYVMQGIIAED